MPNKNIVFIQLQKRLLNDPRWFMISEKAQLLLIKVWLALANYDNRLTKDEVALISILRYDLPINEMKSCLAEIKKNFPNFHSNKHFYYWKHFEEYTNYVWKGKDLGRTKEGKKMGYIDIDIDKHIDIDKGKIPPTIEEVTNYCKERNNKVDPNKFLNHYQAKGWLIGRNKMKDWKAAVRTWENAEERVIHKPGKTPVKFRVMSMRTAKMSDPDIKQELVTAGYLESEIDEALGKVF